MGSPVFAVPSLEHLVESTHHVVAVVTQPDRPTGRKLKVQSPPVKSAAERFGLNVFQPQTTKTPDFLNLLKGWEPEIIVVVAYGEILRKSVLDLPSRGAVNLHASLLPRYRGAAPIAWAILNGDSETGTTTMQMNESMDAGPIYLQQSCRILPDDTSESLSRKLSISGAALVRRTLELIESGQASPIPQDPSFISYAPKLKKEDGLIDWTEDGEQIARRIRAFDPWPGTYTYRNRMLIKFWKANAFRETHRRDPGTIVRVLKESIHISCTNDSALEVFEVQPENRSRMGAAEFINGYRIQEGERFGRNFTTESLS